MLVQFDPPGLGFVSWQGDKPFSGGVIFDEEERWRTLAAVWQTLTQAAQRVLHIPIDWSAYLGA